MKFWKNQKQEKTNVFRCFYWIRLLFYDFDHDDLDTYYEVLKTRDCIDRVKYKRINSLSEEKMKVNIPETIDTAVENSDEPQRRRVDFNISTELLLRKVSPKCGVLLGFKNIRRAGRDILMTGTDWAKKGG